MKNSKKFFGLVALFLLCNYQEIKAIEYFHTTPRNNGIWKRAGNGDNITLNNQSLNQNYNDGGSIIRLEGDSTTTITGGLNIEAKSSINNLGSFSTTYHLEGIFSTGDSNGSPKLNADNVSIKLENTNLDLSTELNGVYISSGTNANIKNLNINLILNPNQSSAAIKDLNAIQLGGGDYEDLGTDSNHRAISRIYAPTYPDRESKLITNNTNITLVNNLNNTNGYALYGLFLEKNSNTHTSENVYFESTNNLNLQIIDNNTNPANPDDIAVTGIHVLGENSKIVLNNSNLKIKTLANSKADTSDINAAIVVGDNNLDDEDTIEDFEDVATRKSGTLESKGKMVLDTTESPNLTTISMHGIESEFKADFANSSSEIKSGNTAIKYWGKTTPTYSYNGKNQVVSFKNAKITSNSTEPYRYLIEVDENVNNATFNLSGKDSIAKADNGMLLYIKGHGPTTSDITLNIDDNATIVGEINRHLSGRTYINLNNNSTWKIDKAHSFRSSISELNIKNGSILDLSDESVTPSPFPDTHNDYTLKVFTPSGDGTVTNDGGTITLANTKYNDSLTINGNYTGKNNAQIKMNTLWNAGGDANGANSESDKVNIYGIASGTTRIIPVSVNGTENLIDGSIAKVAQEINTVPVVYVDSAPAGTFVGKAQTTGAGEVQLTSRLNNGRREFYWTLNAANTDGTSNSISNKPTSNVSTNTGASTTGNSTNFIPIYSSVVPAYINVAKVNKDLGYTTLATLHERRGENDINSKNSEAQAWARIIGKRDKNNGKYRFDTETDIFGVQAGYDFSIKNAENGKRHTGVYFANTTANTDFFDRYRAENGVVVSDKYTGKVKTSDFSLGLTTTKYYKNGLYLDLVGQLSFIKNKYKSRTGIDANQRGTAFAISVETGRDHKITNNFSLDPQIQLIYQYLNLRDFNDGIRKVHYGSDSSLKGRIGLRGTFNKDKATDSTTFYTLANIWHNFDGSVEANIGQDRIKEKYARTTGEIGLGVQVPVTNSAYVYSDLRYERSFSSSPRYKGYRATLGFKYSF